MVGICLENFKALVVRGNHDDRGGKDGEGSKSGSRRFRENCYECGEKGHLKKDCPRKPQDREGGSGSMNVASSSNWADGDCLSVLSSPKHSDSWILDSACSFHMTPKRGWFDTYEFVDSGMVTMDDSSAAKIASKLHVDPENVLS